MRRLQSTRIIKVIQELRTLLVLAKGIICFLSTKQKVNMRSLTEAQLVSVYNNISKVLWKKLFIEAQGHKVTTNVIQRDNTSSMKLEENGKQMQHFNIKFFSSLILLKERKYRLSTGKPQMQ